MTGKRKNRNVIWRRGGERLLLTEQGLRYWGFDHRFDGRNLAADTEVTGWGKELLVKMLGKFCRNKERWNAIRRAAEDLAIRFIDRDRTGTIAVLN